MIDTEAAAKVTVTARRWSGGWELWNEDTCWTQVRHLTHAADQVRDYLDTIDPDTDHSTWQVVVTPDTDLAIAANARAAADTARAAAADAATQSRQAVTALLNAGISTTDTAVLMGITKGRVSQLSKSA